MPSYIKKENDRNVFYLVNPLKNFYAIHLTTYKPQWHEGEIMTFPEVIK